MSVLVMSSAKAPKFTFLWFLNNYVYGGLLWTQKHKGWCTRSVHVGENNVNSTCFPLKPSVQELLRCSPLQTQMSNLMSCHWPKHITHVGWCIGNSPQWPSRNFMMVWNRAARRLWMWNAELYLPAIPSWLVLVPLILHPESQFESMFL